LSCLASVALAAPDGATTSGDTNKADECLAAPKAATPPGGHWYYRLERGTRRKCWYLGDEGGKVKSAAKPAAPSRHAKSTSSEPPMQPKVANARAEIATPAAPVAEWPTEADAQLPARRAPQTLASAAPEGTREVIAENSQGQTPAQATTSSIPETGAQTNNASSGASADTARADAQPQVQPVTAQPAAAPPVHVRTAVVRPVSAQPPAAPQATASTFSPFRIALGLLVVVIALAAFMNRHLLQRLGRRYFGLQAEQPQPRQRRDIWAPLDQDAERATYEDMVAEPVELAEPPRWVRNVRELAEAREHVERLHAQTHAHEPAYHEPVQHEPAYQNPLQAETDAERTTTYDEEPIEPRRSADELEDLLRRVSQRPASPRRDIAAPRELATPRAVSATRARTSTDRSGARA